MVSGLFRSIVICIAFGLSCGVATNSAAEDFSGPVDIGDGRHLYLVCRGAGSPTVILESGYHDSSDPWSLAESGTAVLPAVAEFTRVCTYDRPGTILYGSDTPRVTDRSTPATMPRDPEDIVADLHKLIGAAKIPAPYVFVGHSMGGLITRLYVQIHPDWIVGMVLVDAFPVELPTMFGEGWPAYRKILTNPLPQFASDSIFERIDVDAAISEIAAAPPLRKMPLVVLTKGEPFGHPPDNTGFSFDELERLWPLAAENLVRLEPDTPQIIAHGSDHYIQVNQADLVVAAIKLVIERAGRPAAPPAP